VILRSERLAAAGFAHGFSTRRGGASTGPFSSLNLARNVGDSPDAVAENLRRFAGAAGLDLDRLYWASQVHGAEVVVLADGDRVETIREREADALVASSPGLAVGIRTADCVPILLADPASRRVAAVHAGWRGLVRGVIQAALRAFAGGPGTIAAIGPAIGPCCFEVGDDVADEIAAAAGPEVRLDGSPPRVDLPEAARRLLAAGGVAAIDRVGGCTRCEVETFFSFRRDGKKAGRMLSAIRSG